MSSWLSRNPTSHQTQLVITALVSGAVVAGTIFGLQHVRRRVKLEDLKRSIPDVGKDHEAERLSDYGIASGQTGPDTTTSWEDERSATIAARARRGDYDNELILEQLARNQAFLTDAGLSRLRSSFVIVVGCGGVGSHATAALCRSGLTKIRLIDFDQVTLSSLSRHAVATLADVGTPKVECLRKRLEQITPWVQFDCRNELFRLEAADGLLGAWKDEDQQHRSQPVDYIIDAIDNIDSKVALLSYCHQKSLRVISSMGAGCKSDPTRIFIGDISTSMEDPLSRSTRRRLRAQGIETGIPVVYSTEKPGPGKAQLLPLPEEELSKGEVGELSVLPDFRVRILPVLGTMPAVFGYSAANHVILEITGYPHEYGVGKGRDKMYEGILSTLQGVEERLAREEAKTQRSSDDSNKDATVLTGLKIPVTKDDVGYLIEEVYRGKSVLSGIPTRLTLIRWRRPAPLPPPAPTTATTDKESTHDKVGSRCWPNQRSAQLELTNLVCMTKEEAAVHEKVVLSSRDGKEPEEVYDEKVVRLVERRKEEERGFALFR